MLREDTAAKGIGPGVLAYGLFALHDAVVKGLVAGLPVWQVLLFRGATILAACLAIGRRPLLERAAATPLKRMLFWRSVVNLIAWLCFYSAAWHSSWCSSQPA